MRSACAVRGSSLGVRAHGSGKPSLKRKRPVAEEPVHAGFDVTGGPRRLLVAWLSLSLAAMLGGSSVLCVGPEGHVAVERASAHCCGAVRDESGALQLPAVSVTGPTLSRLESGACGNCLDLQVFSRAPVSGPRLSGLPPASSVAPISAVGCSVTSAPGSGSGSLLRPERSLGSLSTRTFARTISLRC